MEQSIKSLVTIRQKRTKTVKLKSRQKKREKGKSM